jgi:hypothetical protein
VGVRAAALLLVASAAAAAPHLGPWGEDPLVVPRFSLKEERRAPKCPDTQALWKQLQGARDLENIEGGLLVCNLTVGHPMDTMGHVIFDAFTLGAIELLNANVTLRLTLRKDPTIVWWAPFKHNASFVSVPAIKLAKGDAVDLALVDRGVFHDKSLGRAHIKWDGRSPLVLDHGKWTAACALLTAGEALFAARPWLKSVDRQLARIDDAKPDRTKPDLGRPPEIEQLKGLWRDDEREGNLRYAAGFLGWGHPLIATRLGRLKSSEAAFEAAMASEMSALLDEAPAAPLLIGDAEVRFSSKNGPLTVRVDGNGPLDCTALFLELEKLMGVDQSGRFHKLDLTVRDARGHRCKGERIQLQPPLRGTHDPDVQQVGRIRLIRAADGNFVRAD